MPLFVAVFPPGPVKDVLQTVASRRVTDVHWATADYWHITLRFFGEASVDTVVDRLGHLAASPARATLGPATSAPWGPRTLVVPVTGLDQLAAQIAAATRDVGQPEKPFFGHIGLARSGSSVESLVGIEIGVSFDVTDLTLVDSDWSTFPPRYTEAARFTL